MCCEKCAFRKLSYEYCEVCYEQCAVTLSFVKLPTWDSYQLLQASSEVAASNDDDACDFFLVVGAVMYQ